MNFFQKAFCRCFQAVLRLALPVLPYRSPRVLEAVGDIPGCLKEKNIQNVLVVTDGFLHISGMLEPLKKALAENGIRYTIYDEVVPNPTVLNVELARERYLENSCQALIGFGGGSSIDCAKAVGARIARPNKPIPKMRGILKVLLPILFLIAVPTTAGTGSETTLATVITDDKNAHKFPINEFPLIPRVAVLDPEMTRSLPKNMTSTTGMDALTHAIENPPGNRWIFLALTIFSRRCIVNLNESAFHYRERRENHGRGFLAHPQDEAGRRAGH